MARGINKVILIGNLGQDPEIRYTQSQSAVANLRVATTEGWRDKQSGEMREETEWHSVVMFGKLGEIAERYLKKGSKVYIEGRLQTRKWQDKSGNDRYTTEIIARDMQMLDGRSGGGEGGGQGQGGYSEGGYGGGRQQPQRGGGGRPQQAPQQEPVDTYPDDDDIPF